MGGHFYWNSSGHSVNPQVLFEHIDLVDEESINMSSPLNINFLFLSCIIKFQNVEISAYLSVWSLIPVTVF